MEFLGMVDVALFALEHGCGASYLGGGDLRVERSEGGPGLFTVAGFAEGRGLRTAYRQGGLIVTCLTAETAAGRDASAAEKEAHNFAADHDCS